MNQAKVSAAVTEVHMLDLVIGIAKHKRLVIWLPVVCTVLASAIAFFLPNIYIGTARVLPPMQQQQATAALLGQLTNLAGLSASGLGLKNPADVYVGLLGSRTIADKLIEQFKLQALYDEDTLVDTRKELEKRTQIRVGKDSIIELSVSDVDPVRAAAIANAYVEELDKLSQSLAITEAAQRRLFFDRQLKEAKADLTKAEIELRKTQESSGLIQLDEQAKAIMLLPTLRAKLWQRRRKLQVCASLPHPRIQIMSAPSNSLPAYEAN
jgi:tyrosine-protein kinase Etk/Wzc